MRQSSGKNKCKNVFRCASPEVNNTFGFQFCQRLWALWDEIVMADMEVDRVADMEVDMGADMEQLPNVKSVTQNSTHT